MKKDTKIYLILIVIVLIIIFSIIFLKSNKDGLTKKELLCLAEKSELYTSSMCGHCENQKSMLLDNLKKYDLDLSIFNIIICNENQETLEKCREKAITGVPTWIINNEQYKGVRDLKTLKDLAQC